MKRFLISCLLPFAAHAAVDFKTQVQPVLEKSCLGCHHAERGAGNVRVQSKEALLKGSAARPAVVPGKPDQSPLYLAVKNGSMPPTGPKLTAAEVDALKTWIAEGANWPDGVVLGAKAAGALKDDSSLSQALYQRIKKKPQEKSAAEMKKYSDAIPGTDVTVSLVPIPAGEFQMGTPDTEKGHKKSEGPVHTVKIEPFWMQEFEVTWDQYRLFMFAAQDGQDKELDAVSHPTRPYVEMSFGMGINGYPAISMTQHAANKFAQWLSAKTGHFYRLPTEAEWEYACRAGAQTAYPFGDDPSKLDEYAWYEANSNGKYQLVGKKKPNAWGLYDMIGNVMEWTLDQYDPNFYSTLAGKTVTEPWNHATKPYPHVARGGSWNDSPSGLRCGARVASDPSWKMQDPQLPKSIWYHTDAQWLGFRLVRPLKVPSAEEMDKYWNNGVSLDP